MVDVYKTRKQMIMNEVKRVVLSDSKVALVTLIDSDTGEILEEDIPVNKNKLNELDKIGGNCAEPYARYTINEEVTVRYLDPLGSADFRRVHKLIRSIDSFGRMKYGNNLQQYCRTYDDVGRIIELDGRQLSRFIKTIRDAQIIRVVSVDKALLGVTQYITLNPAIAINGSFYDRFTVFSWLDVIQEYDLLPEKIIKKIIGN
ncbi:MAG: hypothetical protein ACRCZ0_02085 [Cetobacterium sp.]